MNEEEVWIPFKSKWGGECIHCNQTILIGSSILWNKKTKKVMHEGCKMEPIKKGWRKTKCPDCCIEINHNRNIHQPNGLCEDCKNKEDHELMFK